MERVLVLFSQASGLGFLLDLESYCLLWAYVSSVPDLGWITLALLL
jgi:hypothetical protein